MKHLLIGTGLMTLIASGPAFAGTACGPRDDVLAQLSDNFGENRQAIGLAGNNALMEFFASPDSGSWTILMTRPDGTTCAIAAGTFFEKQALNEAKGQKT